VGLPRLGACHEFLHLLLSTLKLVNTCPPARPAYVLWPASPYHLSAPGRATLPRPPQPCELHEASTSPRTPGLSDHRCIAAIRLTGVRGQPRKPHSSNQALDAAGCGNLSTSISSTHTPFRLYMKRFYVLSSFRARKILCRCLCAFLRLMPSHPTGFRDLNLGFAAFMRSHLQ
jgi:hypothetical protein